MTTEHKPKAGKPLLVFEMANLASLAKKSKGPEVLLHIATLLPGAQLYPTKLAETCKFAPARTSDYVRLLEGAGLVKKNPTGVKNGVILTVTSSLIRQYLQQYVAREKSAAAE